ncbi:MAG: hypothetical protein ABI678_13870 [Kofleriaceae bacterium]
MSRSLCLLAISLCAAGCSDDAPSCGSNAAEFGLTAAADPVSLTYGDLMARAGNDCPAPGVDPSVVVSLTISGTQMGGTGLINFCIPRPDQMNDTDIALGADVKLDTLNGSDAACTYVLDKTHIPTGTLHAMGVCTDGTDPAGFALAFDGFVGLTQTCGSTAPASVAVRLGGTVAVTPVH